MQTAARNTLYSFVLMRNFTRERGCECGVRVLRNMFRKVAPAALNLFVRGTVLFIIGGFLAMVLFMLSVLPEAQKRRWQVLPIEVFAQIYSTAWWIPPSCGTAAAVVGLIYPCSDSRLGKPHVFQREWSSVTRCVAMFVGISHACAVSFLLKRMCLSRLATRRISCVIPDSVIE